MPTDPSPYPFVLTAKWFTGYRRDLPGRKLPMYLLVESNGAALGRLEYYSRWRKFSLAPIEGTVFESQRLRDLATLCDELTQLHRTLLQAQRTRHGAVATVPEED